jgi:hypothetical protein
VYSDKNKQTTAGAAVSGSHSSEAGCCDCVQLVSFQGFGHVLFIRVRTDKGQQEKCERQATQTAAMLAAATASNSSASNDFTMSCEVDR